MRNARVFISCGQSNSDEIATGRAVEAYFLSRGFVAYFADRVHSSDALTSNVFETLRNSEYFVFIDFRRDAIGAGLFRRRRRHRGSLFVNQEIAIATFLGLTGVGFIQTGVHREGILKYHIYNALPFNEGSEIIAQLDALIQDWDRSSVHELKILDRVGETKNVVINDHPLRPTSDWYHLVIANRNRTKHAFAVHVYVSKIVSASNGVAAQIPTNELIWSGIAAISANIMAGTERELDAFCHMRGEPILRFHRRPLSTNKAEYELQPLTQGQYEIEYTVISENFAATSASFILDFAGAAGVVRFERKYLA